MLLCCNMKNSWNEINRLTNDKKNRKQVISSLKRPDDNSLTNDPLEISNIFNNYFSSVGKNLPSRVPRSSRYFTEYLSPNYNPSSFFFDPLTPEEIEREILLIAKNKTYCLYSCPIRILTGRKKRYLGPSLHHHKHICAKGHLFIQTEKSESCSCVQK